MNKVKYHDMYMYSYKMKSAGAIKLQQALDIYQIKHEGSNVVGKPSRVLINWGSGSELPGTLLKCGLILNTPKAVMNVIDKVDCYDLLQLECRIPDWTTSERTAKKWIKDGYTVLARLTTQGKQGEGIIVLNEKSEFVSAPVYCKYIDKDAEYRVHVFNGEAIYFQVKLPHNDQIDETLKNDYIYNYASGWKLVNLISKKPPEDAVKQSLLAVKASGLNFGAVDVIVKDGKAYVLEINSAPWLNDNVAEAYANAIREFIGELDG